VNKKLRMPVGRKKYRWNNIYDNIFLAATSFLVIITIIGIIIYKIYKAPYGRNHRGANWTSCCMRWRMPV